uniref:Uncharacterized protein n=1 Tax=Daucus carota subsp. sativus TaxID=79200 RepID=A0A161ZY79_DAUCS
MKLNRSFSDERKERCSLYFGERNKKYPKFAKLNSFGRFYRCEMSKVVDLIGWFGTNL